MKRIFRIFVFFVFLSLFVFSFKTTSAIAAACTAPADCNHSNLQGCEGGYTSVDGTCTTGKCCKQTPTCTAPADCNHSNLQGCEGGYTSVDGTCTTGKCCKQQTGPDVGTGCPSCATGYSWDATITNTDDGTQGMCTKIVQNSTGETAITPVPPTRTPCDPNQTCTDGCGCGATNCTKTTTFHPGILPCGGSNGTCQTAIGPISTDFTNAIQTIFQTLLAVSSLVAIVLIIFSAYRLLVSQGNPENVQKAREQLTAAIVGLLFIIFAFVILQFIGVNLLGLPGLSL